MRIIGLTGGIGSGKSTVSRYLTERGYLVLDADKIARGLTADGSAVLTEMEALFGKEVFLREGVLDRKKLAAIVFSDPAQKNKLDELLHHKVIEIMLEGIKQARADGRPAVFADVPLLFESGFDRYVDEVWAVFVSDPIRVRRVMLRDGCDEQSVRQKIRAQMDEAEKHKKADHILDNSGEKEKLYEQIETLLKKI